jgi:3-oxoacyl-[acyl-carrier protein] reductase
MNLGLKDKRALVTAASEGLGLACAERLALEGCAVAICGRRPDALESARRRLESRGASEVLAVPADISDSQAVKDLVARVLTRFGTIDILVVNSGHVDYGGLEDLSDEQWQQAFDLLLMSAVRLARLCLPSMRTRGSGDIVFLGSATVREPPAHLLLSTVMRLGVVGLAKTLASAVAADGVRVNVVAPGYFDSGRVRRQIRSLMDEKGLSERPAQVEIAGRVPMERVGSPEELAALVAFVVSRQAGFMTGSILSIDGGGTRALF